MNNVESMNKLIDELENDEETIFMKDNSGLEKSDEEILINSFLKRANLFDNSGIALSYEKWKEIFFDVVDIITYNIYQDTDEKQPNRKEMIDDTINRSIVDNAPVSIHIDIFKELDEYEADNSNHKTK